MLKADCVQAHKRMCGVAAVAAKDMSSGAERSGGAVNHLHEIAAMRICIARDVLSGKTHQFRI